MYLDDKDDDDDDDDGDDDENNVRITVKWAGFEGITLPGPTLSLKILSKYVNGVISLDKLEAVSIMVIDDIFRA